MERNKASSDILAILLKNMSTKPTVSSLAKEIGLSRVGVWKILKKMQSEKELILSKDGPGKTNSYTVYLNWDNPLVEKKIELLLTQNALKNQRWLDNFAELQKKVNFLILYGSIINFPKEAGDIDILLIASGKNKFIEIEEVLNKIQTSQIKKIHAITFTPQEFRDEIKKPNRAFIYAVKKGVILYGQEKFIRFIKETSAK